MARRLGLVFGFGAGVLASMKRALERISRLGQRRQRVAPSVVPLLAFYPFP